MRNSIVVFSLLLSLLGNSLVASGTKATVPAPVLISNTTIIDVMTGDKRNADIVINSGKIASILEGGTATVPESAILVNGSGTFAIPGLWDMHVHLSSDPELEDRVLTMFIVNGVTGVRDTGGILEKVLAVREKANNGNGIAPRVYIAGPAIDGVPATRPDTSASIDNPEAGIALVESLADRGVDFIKLYEMLRPETFTAMVKRAHELGLQVTAHIPARMTTPQALALGLEGIEHMRGMEFDCARDPNKLLKERIRLMDENNSESGMKLRRLIHATVRPEAFASQDPKNCTKLIQSFVEYGTWHTPTLHIVAFRALRYYDDPSWIGAYRYLPVPIRDTWRERLTDYTNEFKYLEWEEHGHWAIEAVNKMYKTGVKFLAGTDSPGLIFVPGFSLHDELGALATAGLPPLAILQTATINPARYFKISDQIGSIEEGKLADIVLLKADPLEDIGNTRKITTVISRGHVYDRSTLDKLLSDMVEE